MDATSRPTDRERHERGRHVADMSAGRDPTRTPTPFFVWAERKTQNAKRKTQNAKSKKAERFLFVGVFYLVY